MTSTRVHAFRCTDEVWSQLKALAKECGISLNRYLTETGLKHHPRQRLTKEEVDALNSLVYARTDLIKITSVLSKKTDEERLPSMCISIGFYRNLSIMLIMTS